MQREVSEMIDAMKRGDTRALARTITLVENRSPGWKEAMQAIYGDTGSACVFGITGSPGAGKSTLTNEIALRLHDQGYSLGIIAVDPSSPFSGGALLGDRLRMRNICMKTDIFIRSMATRGVLGGLCQAARDVVRILDAAGKDIILIETVGAGQDEIDVVRVSNFVMVVCIPGQGDGIQAIKAGIMEIADLFIVNKADLGGADEIVADINGMLDLCTHNGIPRPPIMKTSTETKEGLDALVENLIAYARERKAATEVNRNHVKEEILSLLEREVFHFVREELSGNGRFEEAVEQVLSHRADPYSTVEELLGSFPLYRGMKTREK